jgi:hypothetical protein
MLRSCRVQWYLLRFLLSVDGMLSTNFWFQQVSSVYGRIRERSSGEEEGRSKSVPRANKTMTNISATDSEAISYQSQ